MTHVVETEVAPAGQGVGPCHTGPPSTNRCRHGDRLRGVAPTLVRDGRAFALCTSLFLGLAVAVRAMVQLRWGTVTGLDTGNWLTLGHAWLGDSTTGTDSTYPPVVPVAVALLGELLSPLATFVLLGAVATATYGGCAALVLWRAGCGWWSLPLALVLTGGSAAGEAVAWGGFPQLLGLGLALLVLYLFAELLVAPTVRTAWTLGGATLLLGATSHLVLAEAAVASALMVLLRFLSPLPRPTWRGLRRLSSVYVRALVPCLLLLPLYLRLTATVGDSFAARRDGQSRADLLHAVDLVIRELPALWRPAIVCALLLPLVLWRERHRPLWLVSASLSLVLTLVAVASPEPRFAYLVPLLVVAAGGLLASSGPLTTRPLLHRLGVTVLAIGLAASAVRGLDTFPGQVRYYGSYVPAGTIEALDDLRSGASRDAVVLVPPVRSIPFGWWIEGYGQREAFVGSSPQWLNFPRERQRAALAVRLFSAADVLSDRWLAAVGAEGMDVVYLPANYDGTDTMVWQALMNRRPELVLHSSPAALILKVP